MNDTHDQGTAAPWTRRTALKALDTAVGAAIAPDAAIGVHATSGAAMTMRLLRLLFAAVLCSKLSACAHLGDRALCAWLELEDMPGLTVVAPRVLDPDYPSNRCGSAAGQYVLRRDAYVVEIWNGRSTGNGLYLRAFLDGGSRLKIRGADFAEVHPTVGTIERTYDVLLDLRGLASGRGTPLSMPATVKFQVLEATGGVLGTESIRLLQRQGSYPFPP